MRFVNECKIDIAINVHAISSSNGNSMDECCTQQQYQHCCMIYKRIRPLKHYNRFFTPVEREREKELVSLFTQVTNKDVRFFKIIYESVVY